MSTDADLQPELVLSANAEIGEGPVWDQRTNTLLWVDITAGEIHRFDPISGNDLVFVVGQPVGFVVPRLSGGFVAGVQGGIVGIDDDFSSIEILAEIEPDNSLTRLNDGKCDPVGRLWAGTMEFDSKPGEGALYLMETDLSVTQVIEEVSCSNGLGWSLDGSQMYYIDTPTGYVDVLDYDLDTGSATDRRHFAAIPSSRGKPDGMTVDSEGYLWVALWGGAAVRRFAPDGSLDRVVSFPVSQTTSCEFGGLDLEDLYVTSACSNYTPEQKVEQPLAGSLFRLRPGVQGRPVIAFAG